MPTTKFFNRELSWLEFNQRVLDEATDNSIPLLERLKFLAITCSNLDEFFMVRVGGLRLLEQRDSSERDPAGMTPSQQLKEITTRVRPMVASQYACFNGELTPQLELNGIRRIKSSELSERQLETTENFFESEIYPILTPVAVNSDHPVPLLANRHLNLCVRLRSSEEGRKPKFALIPFGPIPSRFITLPSDGEYSFILFEDVVQLFVDRFFPGEEVLESVPFRISRNADLSVRDEFATDLAKEMELLLTARKISDCIRLEVSDQSTKSVRSFLKRILEVDDRGVYEIPGPLDLSDLHGIAGLSGFDSLKYPNWPPQPSPAYDPRESIFATLSRRDLLLHHPYESFDPVIRLLEESAEDPDVLAIKQTLYRTSKDSPIVQALERAADAGKHVTAIVEVKARFDEARNIEWARELEQKGVHVIYGVKGLKTHAKVCLIVRREAHGIQRYVHFGTGNYNEQTARLYTDISFMTSNEELGADATLFLHTITGYSQPQRFHKLAAAPIGLRERLIELIDGETERCKQGQKARIMAKLNSLVDPEIIKRLYVASQAGVSIQLNVRGICCLRPGVKGLSENVQVVSIIDRFLEHSRIIYFHHGGEKNVFISSADWMPRNLDRRIELLAPVEDPDCKQRVIEVLEVGFQDKIKARRLQKNGTTQRLRPTGKRRAVRSQERLYELASRQARQPAKPTLFEPHKAATAEEL